MSKPLPPFLLYDVTPGDAVAGKPWWAVLEIPLAERYLFVVWCEPDAVLDTFGLLSDDRALFASHCLCEHNDQLFHLVHISLEEGNWNYRSLVHELIHLADQVMLDKGFEGTEFRAYLVDHLLAMVWELHRKQYRVNTDLPDELKDLTRKLRKLI